MAGMKNQFPADKMVSIITLTDNYCHAIQALFEVDHFDRAVIECMVKLKDGSVFNETIIATEMPIRKASQDGY